MAEATDPGPVSIDPELSANLTRVLNIRGPLGLLKVLDTIVPVVSMGDIAPATVEVLQPAYRSTDIFSNGVVTNPAAGAILAGTGPLAAGTYDVKMSISINDNTVNPLIEVQHRNAADTANLSVYTTIGQGSLRGGMAAIWFEYAYELLLNERLRIVTTVASGGVELYSAVIFARRRT